MGGGRGGLPARMPLRDAALVVGSAAVYLIRTCVYPDSVLWPSWRETGSGGKLGQDSFRRWVRKRGQGQETGSETGSGLVSVGACHQHARRASVCVFAETGSSQKLGQDSFRRPAGVTAAAPGSGDAPLAFGSATVYLMRSYVYPDSVPWPSSSVTIASASWRSGSPGCGGRRWRRRFDRRSSGRSPTIARSGSEPSERAWPEFDAMPHYEFDEDDMYDEIGAPK